MLSYFIAQVGASAPVPPWMRPYMLHLPLGTILRTSSRKSSLSTTLTEGTAIHGLHGSELHGRNANPSVISTSSPSQIPLCSNLSSPCFRLQDRVKSWCGMDLNVTYKCRTSTSTTPSTKSFWNTPKEKLMVSGHAQSHLEGAHYHPPLTPSGGETGRSQHSLKADLRGCKCTWNHPCEDSGGRSTVCARGRRCCGRHEISAARIREVKVADNEGKVHVLIDRCEVCALFLILNITLKFENHAYLLSECLSFTIDGLHLDIALPCLNLQPLINLIST